MCRCPSRIVCLVAVLVCSNRICFRTTCFLSIPAIKCSALLCPVIRQFGTHTIGIRSQVCTTAAVTNQCDFVCNRRPARIKRICCFYFHTAVCFYSSCLCSVPAVKGISRPCSRCRQSTVCTACCREFQSSIIIVNQCINSNGAITCISCRICSGYCIYSASCHSE